MEKLHQHSVNLGEYVNEKIFYGIKTGLNEAFIVDAATRGDLIEEDKRSAELIVPFLAGRDIKRYAEPTSDRFLILIPRGWTRDKSGGAKDAWRWLQQQYPAIARHLSPFAAACEKRYDKGEFWWELRACDYYSEFKKPKMMLPDISLRGNFMLDPDGIYYCVNTAYIISIDDKYLLGILNSNLTTFIYGQLSSSYRGGYLRFIYQYLVRLPIHAINFADPVDAARHARMVGLVESMLSLHKQAGTARLPQEKEMIQRQIESTDRQIDRLVYELYGLTEEEVKIVEGSAP
jgi:hypothetical protein